MTLVNQQIHLTSPLYTDLFPKSIGRKSLQNSDETFFDSESDYFFIFIKKGKLIFSDDTNKKNYIINQAQGGIIFPETRISLTTYFDTPCHYYWIQLSGLVLKSFFTQISITPQNPIYKCIEDQAQDIFYVLDQLLQQIEASDMQILSSTYLLLNHIQQASEAPINQLSLNNPTNQYLQTAIQFIHENYSENITIESIAESANLSTNHLTRLFKQEFNITPHAYLVHYRMAVAQDLLSQTSESIESIAIKVGYSNQFYFSTSFKKQFQMSPSKWRLKFETHLPNVISNNLIQT